MRVLRPAVLTSSRYHILSDVLTWENEDLNTEEITDLFGCVHKIGPMMEEQYGASALNIAVQVSVAREERRTE